MPSSLTCSKPLELGHCIYEPLELGLESITISDRKYNLQLPGPNCQITIGKWKRGGWKKGDGLMLLKNRIGSLSI